MAQYDFEPPSFSLGLEESQQVPSFSLGIDEMFPPTPAANASRQQRNVADPLLDSLDFEKETPKRNLKRLKRGPVGPADCELISDPCSSRSPQVQKMCTPDADDIEEFSSEDEDRPVSQRYNPRSFSALKPIRTPPVFEKGISKIPQSSPSTFESGISIKKTSLGSKEVRFQDVPDFPKASFQSPGPSSSSGMEKVPVYEFRDNQICINVEESEDEESAAVPGTSTDARIADLLRQRLPHFSFVDDLEQGNTGEPVYIDYRGQFGERRSAAKIAAASRIAVKQPKITKKNAGRRKRKQQSSENSQVLRESNTGKKGYWLTEGGSKVYITADGQRLYGGNGYKRYLRDNGKRARKQKTSNKKK